MDLKVRHQLHVVTDLVTAAGDELQAHVASAHKAFISKDAAAHKSALDLISRIGQTFSDRANLTHVAIAAGAPTGAVDVDALDAKDKARADAATANGNQKSQR